MIDLSPMERVDIDPAARLARAQPGLLWAARWDEDGDRVRQAYGEATWDRLVALKRHYDPANVFHLNQNVDPS